MTNWRMFRRIANVVMAMASIVIVNVDSIAGAFAGLAAETTGSQRVAAAECSTTSARELRSTQELRSAQGLQRAQGSVSVAIVVEGSGGQRTACITVAQGATGVDLLFARASALGMPAPRFDPQSGLLCAIDGYPATGCAERTASGYAYWSYWTGDSGNWVYSSIGPGSRHLAAGRMDGWRFVTGTGQATDVAPSTAAVASNICVPATTTTQPPVTQPPTTRPPTTPAPTTQAPTTRPPATQRPTTQAPTTQAQTTQAPAGQASVTQPITGISGATLAPGQTGPFPSGVPTTVQAGGQTPANAAGVSGLSGASGQSGTSGGPGQSGTSGQSGDKTGNASGGSADQKPTRPSAQTNGATTDGAETASAKTKGAETSGTRTGGRSTAGADNPSAALQALGFAAAIAVVGAIGVVAYRRSRNSPEPE